MNKLFAIGIPTINRWDLLKPFLQNYLINFPDTMIFIVDNGNQAIDVVHDNLTIIVNDQPASVAASWNQLCKMIFDNGIEHAFIINDDVCINRTQTQIKALFHVYPPHGFYISQYGWCSFIIPCFTWKRDIGTFDENYKGAYFEDNDYNRRLKLAKTPIMINMLLNPGVYNESSSIQKDPSLNKNFNDNASYYLDKWGGLVGHEKFLTPFNK